VTINSGGEKIFAEEVEQAIVPVTRRSYDVIVVGRPERTLGPEPWSPSSSSTRVSRSTVDELLELRRPRLRWPVTSFPRPGHLPRRAIVRSPAGKADYRWARAQAEATLPGDA
jgi:acyl-CoA synthetase (AMP-forming)/AMP-acid ligase II